MKIDYEENEFGESVRVITHAGGQVEREIDRAVPVGSGRKPVLSKVEVLRRITPAEWASLQTATDAESRYLFAIFDNASSVDLNDPWVIGLFDSLETLGHLAAGRAAEIVGDE